MISIIREKTGAFLTVDVDVLELVWDFVLSVFCETGFSQQHEGQTSSDLLCFPSTCELFTLLMFDFMQDYTVLRRELNL